MLPGSKRAPYSIRLICPLNLAPGWAVTIRAKIGEGGMSEVYLAHDPELDRKVALKILLAEVAAKSDRMKRFVREPIPTRVMKIRSTPVTVVLNWTHGLKG